jgi:S1-C subfamily serine protease
MHWIIILLSSALIVSAQSSSVEVTADGVTYVDAELIKEYPQSVYISHAAGKSFVNKADLSAEDSDALGLGGTATDQSFSSSDNASEERQESSSKASIAPPTAEEPKTGDVSPEPEVRSTSEQKAEDLPPEAMDAMVVIEGGVEGGKGFGSGFVCSFNGKDYIVTNQHVVSGLKDIRFQTRGGIKLQPVAWQVATDVDIAIIEVQGLPSDIKPFQLLAELSKQVAQGDKVTIPGNSEGGGVITQTHGQLVAIGGQRIETDCPVYPGNSGSPIIHRNSGKVIGVLTEAERLIFDEFTKHSFRDKKSAIKSEVRYFGYRLDTVASWRPIAASALNNERSLLEESRRELGWIADLYTGASDAYKEFKELHVARNEAFEASNRRDLALSEVERIRKRFLWKLEGLIKKAAQRIPNRQLVYVHQEKADTVKSLAAQLATGVEIVRRDDELTMELIKRGR